MDNWIRHIPDYSCIHLIKNRELREIVDWVTKKVLFTVTWPSAVWKDTVVDILLQNHPEKFVKPISFTTRAKRPNEVEWVNYYFITKEDIEIMQEKKEIFESTNFNWNFYWFTIQEMERIFTTWKVPICIVDDYWMRHMDRSGRNSWFPVFKSFILPPNAFELKKRLIKRDWRKTTQSKNGDKKNESFERFKKWNEMIRCALYWGWYNSYITNTNSQITADQVFNLFISIMDWTLEI